MLGFGTVAQAVASGAAIVAGGFINDNAPYPESHASTIVETAPGKLVAAWFGGTKERNPDVEIWVAHHENGKWQPAVSVADGVQPDGKRFPTWNPVLFYAGGSALAGRDAQPARPRTGEPPVPTTAARARRDDGRGTLFLFYKVGPRPSAWWGMLKTSTDGGKTWSDARRLPDGILGPVKNKPVILPDGSWLSGSSTEGNPNGWLLHFERSRDHGATWEKIGPVAKGPQFDAIQPSILLHRDGALQAVGRTKQGVVFQTWSKDGGQSWSPVTATDLPNPSSGTDALTLADGRHLIVYNHTAHRANEPKGDRFPLNVALSDDGVHWNRVLTLDSEPIVSGYAYPAVIQTSDGLVHVTYTFGRKKIKHVVIDPKKL